MIIVLRDSDLGFVRTGAFLVVAALVGACSTSAGESSERDASSGGQADGAEGGAGTAVADLCSKVSSYAKRCPPPTRCAQNQTTYCTTWTASFSAAFQAGLDECIASSQPCLDAGLLFPTATCFRDHLGAPTAAQAKVKTDFCAQCPDGTSASLPHACSDFFAFTVDDAGGSSSVGNAVLVAGDALAATIDSQCTGPAAIDSGIADCAKAFQSCAGSALLFNANLPAPCATP
jgi:hypothetical protein